MRTNKFLTLIRYWDWQNKVQSLALASLVLLMLTDTLKSQALNTIIFVAYLHFPFSFGYLFNSYVERTADEEVKKYFLLDYSNRFIKGILLILALGTLTIPLLFFNRYIMLLVAMGFLLTMAYSSKPLFLKRRGFIGLLTSSVIQFLPFVLFLFLLPNHMLLALYLLGWLFLVSFLVELTYQIFDFDRDVSTHIQTFVVRIGVPHAKQILYGSTILLFFYLASPAIIMRTPIYTLLFFILLIFTQSPLYYACVNLWFEDRLLLKNIVHHATTESESVELLLFPIILITQLTIKLLLLPIRLGVLGIVKIDYTIGQFGILLKRRAPNIYAWLKKY